MNKDNDNENNKMQELTDEQLKQVAGGYDTEACNQCLEAHPDNREVCKELVDPNCRFTYISPVTPVSPTPSPIAF